MSNKIPNFNLLAVFSVVMEQGSLSKAAEYLSTNQSTISTAMTRLKNVLGQDLFIRSGRGVVPSAYASNLYSQIKEPVQQLNEVFQSLGDFDPKVSKRQFVITAPENLQLLVLSQFSNTENKNITLEVFDQPDNDDKMYDGLLTQKFDVMIDYLPPRHPNFESVKLFDSEFIIVCRSNHPRIKDSLTESQYMAETHAVLERTRNKMLPLGHFTSIDISKRKVAYHGGSMFSNMLLCSQSDYITTVPLSMALQFKEQLQLQIFRPPFDYKNVSHYLIWLKKFNHEPSHKWFRDELIETANKIVTKMEKHGF